MRNLVLLTVTLVIAVVLSLAMWVFGVVEFGVDTFSFHVASIYIGVAGVLLFQMWRDRR